MAGAGFVVADGILVTCAHVVTTAASGPGKPLRLAFPQVAEGPEVDGHVLAEAWQGPDDTDVAVVRLAETPAGVRTLALGSAAGCQGHRIRSFGFPRQAPPGGHLGGGKVLDLLRVATGAGRLQLTDANDLTEGFSGAPVLDEVSGLVIGMVTAITTVDSHRRGQGIAYATPTEALRTAWPELNVQDLSPYRGLEPFTVEDSRWFHGRDVAVDRVLEGLAGQRRLLLLLGPSGAGKSSLVHAGVLPALASGGLPGSDRWLPVLARPGQDLMAELDRAGLSGAGEDGIAAAVARRLAAEPDCQRVLLVIDQFEELLTHPAAEPEPTAAHLAAIDRITDAVDSTAALSIVLVMRDDFYHRLVAVAPHLVEAATPGPVNMPADLSIQDLDEIITHPARTAGVRLQEGLPARIIADVLAIDHHAVPARQARVTVLPLLALTLSQLWQDRRNGRLTHETYQRIGGVAGAVSTWCEAALSQLPDEQRPVAQRILTALVRPADEERRIPAVRQQRPQAELRALASGAGAEPTADHAFDEVLTALTRHSIVTTGTVGSRRQPGEVVGEPVAELVHEALIRDWGTLRDWVRKDQQFQDWLRRATEQHIRWTDSGDPDDLLHGTDLAEGLDWQGQRGLTREIGTYLTASRQRQRAAIRRARRLNAILASILLIAIAAAALAVTGQREAQRQQRSAQDAHRLAVAHGLVTQADDIGERDPRTAMRLSLAAEQIHGDLRTTASLFDRVNSTDIAASLTGHASAVQAMAPADRGGLVASAGGDGRVFFWDVTDSRRPVRLGSIETGQGEDGGNGVRAIAWSPDGVRLATAGGDGTLGIWDVTDPAAVRRLGDLVNATGSSDRELLAVAWSPDGGRLAVGGEDGGLRIWDVGTPSRPRAVGARLRGHIEDEGDVYSVAWSPDGATLASAGADKTVILWDTSRAVPRQIGDPLRHSRSLYEIAWSPDGKSLVTAAGLPNHHTVINDDGEDEAIVVWDVADRSRPRRRGEPLETSGMTDVAWSPNGEQLAISLNERVYVVDADDVTRGRRLSGHTERVFALSWYDDGTLISAGLDETVVVWDVRGVHQVRRVPDPLSQGLLAWAPDGRLAAVADSATVAIWDMSRPAQPRRIGEPLPWPPDGDRSADDDDRRAGARAVAWSPDGHILAVGGGGRTGALVQLWDVIDPVAPRRIGQPMAFDAELEWLAWSPLPGARILGIGVGFERYDVSLWDLADSTSPQRLGRLVARGMKPRSFQWSPDGTRIAVAESRHTVYLWDVSSLAIPRLIGDPFNTTTQITFNRFDASPVSWAPDGRTLATTSFSDRVFLWDATGSATPTRIGDGLVGHEGTPLSVAWSPTGETLATIGRDDAIILWDVTDISAPRRIGDALSPPDTTFTGSVAWSPDAQFLVTAIEDGGAIVWDVRSTRFLREHRSELACAAAGGGLTEAQWQQFIPTLPFRPTCGEAADAAEADALWSASPLSYLLPALTLALLVVAGTWLARRRVRSGRRKKAPAGPSHPERIPPWASMTGRLLLMAALLLGTAALSTAFTAVTTELAYRAHWQLAESIGVEGESPVPGAGFLEIARWALLAAFGLGLVLPMLFRSLGQRWPWPVAAALALLGACGMFAGYVDGYTANTAGFLVPAAYLAVATLVRRRWGNPQSWRQARYVTLATTAAIVLAAGVTFSFIGYHSSKFDIPQVAEFLTAKRAATPWLVPLIALPSAVGFIAALPVGRWASRRLPTLSRTSVTPRRWWYRIAWRGLAILALAAIVGTAGHSYLYRPERGFIDPTTRAMAEPWLAWVTSCDGRDCEAVAFAGDRSTEFDLWFLDMTSQRAAEEQMEFLTNGSSELISKGQRGALSYAVQEWDGESAAIYWRLDPCACVATVYVKDEQTYEFAVNHFKDANNLDW
ncbi:nSTAND1 domain-containing NTPase [Micromonospora carbonacea]|uniref:nSTAND1 domain-containing NTPase n=1 Tax=Micromonospora carbonacea TaxID=47853 RepID=UPI0037CA650E